MPHPRSVCSDLSALVNSREPNARTGGHLRACHGSHFDPSVHVPLLSKQATGFSSRPCGAGQSGGHFGPRCLYGAFDMCFWKLVLPREENVPQSRRFCRLGRWVLRQCGLMLTWMWVNLRARVPRGAQYLMVEARILCPHTQRQVTPAFL